MDVVSTTPCWLVNLDASKLIFNHKRKCMHKNHKFSCFESISDFQTLISPLICTGTNLITIRSISRMVSKNVVVCVPMCCNFLNHENKNFFIVNLTNHCISLDKYEIRNWFFWTFLNWQMHLLLRRGKLVDFYDENY